MGINTQIPTDQEELVLNKAVLEFESKGKTDIACPRCGKKLSYFKRGSSFLISCEDEYCIKLSVRGL
jgi:ribosomal protein L37AE/L43A